MKNWKIKRLGDVCLVIAGQSTEGKYYNAIANGLPFYQGKKEYGEKYIGEPTTWTTKITKEAELNDILMSVRAPVGPINFATQNICIGRGLAAIRPSKLIDKEFLFNFLLKHESEIVGNTGAVFNSINKAQIEAINIPLPPFPEQQCIVSILDEPFAAIAKAKANAEQNLKNAKELFESTKSQIFQILKGIEINVPLASVCDEIFAGGDAPKDNFSNKKTEIYNIPIIANAVKDNGLYGYTDLCRVNKPSITIAARGSGTGHTEIRYESFFPIVRLIVLTPNIDKIKLEFLKYSIQNLDILSSGSAIPQLTIPMIKEYSFSLPSISKQQTIISKLDALSVETKRLEGIYKQKIEDLEELKKSVLQKAFRGELTLNDYAHA